MLDENTKTAVIDASFMLSYLMPDERVHETENIIRQFEKQQLLLFSTPVFPMEVLNAVRMAVVRKRINHENSKKIAELFLKIDIELLSVDYQEAYSLALSNELTLYDASYLEVALRRKSALLTLDSRLEKAFNTYYEKG